MAWRCVASTRNGRSVLLHTCSRRQSYVWSPSQLICRKLCPPTKGTPSPVRITVEGALQSDLAYPVLFYPDPSSSGRKSLVIDLEYESCIHTVRYDCTSNLFTDKYNVPSQVCWWLLLPLVSLLGTWTFTIIIMFLCITEMNEKITEVLWLLFAAPTIMQICHLAQHRRSRTPHRQVTDFTLEIPLVSLVLLGTECLEPPHLPVMTVCNGLLHYQSVKVSEGHAHLRDD